jgi:tRNA modification GTPase
VCGPDAGAALTRLTRRDLPPPRQAALRRLWPDSGDVPIDEALVLWFPGPASETGLDMAELQVHGGRAVIQAVATALAACPGLRPAEPGEFTRRAFLNGKLDLTQAEAIADLVAAETEAQRRQALRQMGGALARLYDGWRGRLVRALAHLEATIDFSDEDLPQTLSDSTRHDIWRLNDEVIQHLDDRHVGERLREGIAIALIGAPNAGKSSLLNRLARREAAIVSSKAGTTRDVIEVHLDLQGYPVTLLDTAGLRPTDEEIEAEGVRRALARAADADLKIALFDATASPVLDPTTASLADMQTIPVLNKIDVLTSSDIYSIGGHSLLRISARTGDGIDQLLAAIKVYVDSVANRQSGAPPLTRLRHRKALEECRDALTRAAIAVQPELMAEDLRLAARALGRITGRVDVEDLLDVIFRDFCIGK